MEFAFVAYTNNNEQYMNLLKTTIDSVLLFSKHPIIIYLVDISPEMGQGFFRQNSRIHYRHIDEKLPSIYYYKPRILADAIEKGLKNGYYIEADDVVTPICDGLDKRAKNLGDLPLSPIHPNKNHVPGKEFMDKLGVAEKTQPYIHAAHVLFNSTHLDFMKEWLNLCLQVSGENWDETVLNCMFWKRQCTDDYLFQNDPWYENFYTDQESRYSSCTYHGCKDPALQKKLFDDIRGYYLQTSVGDKDALNKDQSWWNRNVDNRVHEIKAWHGTDEAMTKIYSRQYVKRKGYKTVIDLGCADATMYTGFKKDGIQVDYVGIDSCRFFVEDNNRKGIKTIESDVRSTPFDDNSFDVVYSRHIIEHQPEFSDYMAETIRIAKREALHIFFKRPSTTEMIHYDPKENMYHNTYCKKDIERFLTRHPKVENFVWVSGLNTELEDALHIFVKNSTEETAQTNTEKLTRELDSFQSIWSGGFFNDIKTDERKLDDLLKFLKAYISDKTTVLEVGCGRGAWTKEILEAKKIYCLDALSAEHNGFWNYVGESGREKIEYTQVKDFSCSTVPDNSIDLLFSYDVFCHISYSGMREYMKNIYPKLKSGAMCLVMVADSEKYRTFAEPGITPGYSSHEEEVKDYDGAPSPGRWYWYGVKKFCETLRDCGYDVITEDLNIIKRDPVTMFRKV